MTRSTVEVVATAVLATNHSQELNEAGTTQVFAPEAFAKLIAQQLAELVP